MKTISMSANKWGMVLHGNDFPVSADDDTVIRRVLSDIEDIDITISDDLAGIISFTFDISPANDPDDGP